MNLVQLKNVIDKYREQAQKFRKVDLSKFNIEETTLDIMQVKSIIDWIIADTDDTQFWKYITRGSYKNHTHYLIKQGISLIGFKSVPTYDKNISSIDVIIAKRKRSDRANT